MLSTRELSAARHAMNLYVSHPRRRTPHPRESNDAKHLILLPMGNDILNFVSSLPTSRRRFFIIESTPLSFENHISGAEGARRKAWQQNRLNRARARLQNREHKNPTSRPSVRVPMLQKAAIVHSNRPTGLQETRGSKKRSASAPMSFLSSADGWKAFTMKIGRGRKLKSWPNIEGTRPHSPHETGASTGRQYCAAHGA